MKLDLTAEPFSRYGSYMAFSIAPPAWNQPGLLWRTMHGVGGKSREPFKVVPLLDGREVPYTLDAEPTRLRLEADSGWVEIVFAEPDLVRLRGQGLSVRVQTLGHDTSSYAFPAGGGRWHVNVSACRTQYLFTPLRGTLAMDAPHRVRTQDKRRSQAAEDRPRVVAEFAPDEAGRLELAVEEFRTTPSRRDLDEPFEAALARVQSEWKAWLQTTPALPPAYGPIGERAMYVNWSAVVNPSGNCTRPTMLMSKNWMTQCWSWDHCFNAMALSYRNADLAWDQLMVLFDHQDAHGVLPDAVSAPQVTWNFCKPPVHGWTLSKMARARGLLTDKRVREIYPKLARWTRWWLEQRDYDGDGLPEYHHGNDSGWDNGTVFDGGFPVAGADLAGLLVVQMDVLADLAERLGRPKDAQRWTQRSDRLLATMLERLWDGERFISRKAFTGEVCDAGQCLLPHLAIVAGKRLPKDVREKTAHTLRPDGPFVTANGPATESPDSPLYVPDGYWRGPIWGPEVVIACDGLARAGFRDHARQIARRYCDMCIRAGHLAENYNAQTGEALRDRAYTWGSSAYLVLAHEMLRGR